MVLFWILISLIIFSLLVLIHEYGHYKTARIFWVHVEEFWLGIPPRAKVLWTNKEWTKFTLNWIPLWWFVRIAWESEMRLQIYNKDKHLLTSDEIINYLKSDTDLYDKKWNQLKKSEKKYLKEYLRQFKNGENFFEKNIFQKTLILLAGVIMNIIAAFVIFVWIFLSWANPIGVNTIIETERPSLILPTLDEALSVWFLKEEAWIMLFPIEGSIAAESWIMDWDIVLSVDDRDIIDITFLQEYISWSVLTPIVFLIEREWKEIDIILTPSSEGRIGSYLAPNYIRDEDFRYSFSLVSSMQAWYNETLSQLELWYRGISMILRKLIFPEAPEERSEAAQMVTWPIGIVQVVTLSLSAGIMLIAVLAAVISINLALFNLLPIPALDGWRILLLWLRTWLEKLIWKNTKLNAIENVTHVIFFLLLIALSILIAYNDIIRIIWS